MRRGVFRAVESLTLRWWDKMSTSEDTLKIYRLVIANDEVEYEAEKSVTEYLLKRSSEYANRLGKRNYVLRDFGYTTDPISGDHLFTYYCERNMI